MKELATKGRQRAAAEATHWSFLCTSAWFRTSDIYRSCKNGVLPARIHGDDRGKRQLSETTGQIVQGSSSCRGYRCDYTDFSLTTIHYRVLCLVNRLFTPERHEYEPANSVLE